MVGFTPTCVGTAGAIAATCISATVHPHVRGDSDGVNGWPSRLAGSPPRAWGQPPWTWNDPDSTGFTPTCVGTAQPPRSPSPQVSVHPHVRGDSLALLMVQPFHSGSPLRAWGQRQAEVQEQPPVGFTPTCVGTAAAAPSPATPSRVHPHVRGDSFASPPPGNYVNGSPPRAWGQLLDPALGHDAFRFTPTCVGTAQPPSCRPRSQTVHPHVRGDSIDGDVAGAFGHGSPPRAWGQRSGAGPPQDGIGFTPTCVGTAALSVAYPRSAKSVHPHVRGDSQVRAQRSDKEIGSPPRAWGQRGANGSGSQYLRFTPTCVGTASPTRRPVPRLSVHPHVRGDSPISIITTIRRIALDPADLSYPGPRRGAR